MAQSRLCAELYPFYEGVVDYQIYLDAIILHYGIDFNADLKKSL
jgi:hypothetical protein